jgi:hypothetical protein
MSFSLFQWLMFIVLDFCLNILTAFPGVVFLAFPLGFDPMRLLVLEALVESAFHLSLLFIAQRLEMPSSLTRFAKFALTLTVAEVTLFVGFYSFLGLYTFLVCRSCEWWHVWQGITLHSIRNFSIGFVFLLASNLVPVVIAEGAGRLEMQIWRRLETGAKERYAEFSLRFVLTQVAAFVGFISLFAVGLGQAFLNNSRACLWIGITLSKMWDIATGIFLLTLSNLPLALIAVGAGYFATRTVPPLYQEGAKKCVAKFARALGLTETAAFFACLCLWTVHVGSRFLINGTCQYLGIGPEEMRSIVSEATILLAINLVPILIIVKSAQRGRLKAAVCGFLCA